MSKRRIIGIDIGGTNFRIGVVADCESVEHFQKLPVSEVFVTEDPVSDLAGFIIQYLEKTPAHPDAIAIGFPATINRKRTQILQAPNLPFMENIPVIEPLTKALQIPVFMDRDVNMLLCYDMKIHHIPRSGITCGIYFGTGIGNAIYLNGEFLTGKNGVAGELGHIPVYGSNERCGCGNRGCMESCAGGKYLTRLHQMIALKTPMNELFIHCKGNPFVEQAVERMAIAVATEINILDPDHLLIGGGVLEMQGFPVERFRKKILEYTRKPYPAENLDLIITKDIREKGVVGASIYAKQLL